MGLSKNKLRKILSLILACSLFLSLNCVHAHEIYYRGNPPQGINLTTHARKDGKAYLKISGDYLSSAYDPFYARRGLPNLPEWYAWITPPTIPQ